MCCDFQTLVNTIWNFASPSCVVQGVFIFFGASSVKASRYQVRPRMHEVNSCFFWKRTISLKKKTRLCWIIFPLAFLFDTNVDMLLSFNQALIVEAYLPIVRPLPIFLSKLSLLWWKQRNFFYSQTVGDLFCDNIHLIIKIFFVVLIFSPCLLLVPFIGR